MRIGVLGTGMVGRAVAAKLVELDHQVLVGTRDPAATLAREEPHPGCGIPPFRVWQEQHQGVKLGTFADAAAHGELVVNATPGAAPWTPCGWRARPTWPARCWSTSPTPSTTPRACPDAAGGNRRLARRAHPTGLPRHPVVKALNTMNALLMVNPRQLADGDHTVFVCGDDPQAKAVVTGLLTEGFGWRDVVNLGDITTARGPELLLPLWLRL